MTDTEFLKPIRPGSVTDQAVEMLTSLITSGRVLPLDFLPSEPELCRQLQISRSSVREALRVLEARGLVIRKHGIGVQVIDRALEVVEDSIELMLLRGDGNLRELVEVREILESQAVVLAAQRADSNDIRELRALVDELGQPASVLEHQNADFRFHLRLAEASRNALLVALIHAIRGPLRRTVEASYAGQPEVKMRIAHHTRIIDAVDSHDQVAAEAAVRAHLAGLARAAAAEPTTWATESTPAATPKGLEPAPRSAARDAGESRRR